MCPHTDDSRPGTAVKVRRACAVPLHTSARSESDLVSVRAVGPGDFCVTFCSQRPDGCLSQVIFLCGACSASTLVPVTSDVTPVLSARHVAPGCVSTSQPRWAE